MSEKKLPIKFQLIHIEDNQFSTFEEMLDVEKPIKQEIGFGYGVDVENRSVAVSMEFVLHKGEKPLLKQKITCFFEISPDDFDNQLRNEKEVVLPCWLGKHLAMLTVGTARGVLFANTKNTKFNKYLIGLINVNEMFNQDISIEV